MWLLLRDVLCRVLGYYVTEPALIFVVTLVLWRTALMGEVNLCRGDRCRCFWIYCSGFDLYGAW